MKNLSLSLDRSGTMPIALEGNGGNPIQRSKFIHGVPCKSMYDSPEEKIFAGDERFPVEREEDLDSCSSSIGKNSDLSGDSSDGEEAGETEVQSSLKGPLDSMDALEEVLPIKRGVSKFYNGKSKSFTSLADASSASSIKEFAKPENSYPRKRKNLLAHSNFWEKNRSYPFSRNGNEISKRLANSGRSALTSGVTMSSSESNNNSEDSSSILSSPSRCLPPLHPQGKISSRNGSPSPPPQRNSPWRSFSLSDLQCVAAGTPNITGLAICTRDKDNKLH